VTRGLFPGVVLVPSNAGLDKAMSGLGLDEIGDDALVQVGKANLFTRWASVNHFALPPSVALD